MSNDVSLSPEIQAFADWIYKAYGWLRGLIARLGQNAWRPYYCWIGASINLLVLKGAFYDLPVTQHVYLPEYYLFAILGFTVLMLMAMGLRTFEKIQFGQIGAETTRRLNTP